MPNWIQKSTASTAQIGCRKGVSVRVGIYAGVAELVDARVSKTRSVRSVSSILTTRTTILEPYILNSLLLHCIMRSSRA